MYTLNDFDKYYVKDGDSYEITNIADAAPDADFIALYSIDGEERQSLDLQNLYRIIIYDFNTDTPEIILYTNYTGVYTFESVTNYFSDKDIDGSIHELIGIINDSFDDVAFSFFNSDEWFDSQTYEHLSKLTMHDDIDKVNNIFIQLADIIETGELGFKLDSSFRRKLTKHITLRPNTVIPIDIDAFVFNRILSYKG